MRHILDRYPQTLEATKFESATLTNLEGKPYPVTNTNSSTHSIPGLIASKTGFTELAGGNLAFAFDPEIGRPIIVVILGSSGEVRFTDALKIVEATMSYINTD